MLQIIVVFGAFVKADKWLSGADKQIYFLLFEACLFNDLNNRWTRLREEETTAPVISPPRYIVKALHVMVVIDTPFCLCI